jgi:hypothetical protein
MIVKIELINGEPTLLLDEKQAKELGIDMNQKYDFFYENGSIKMIPKKTEKEACQTDCDGYIDGCKVE